MNTKVTNIWADLLAGLDEQGLRRKLRLVESAQGPNLTIDGRSLCCFASNNYLGLANHPRVIAAVTDALRRWGWGAGASRLITGGMPPHQQLESRLANFKQTESALVCSTGYQANLAAVRALAGKDDVIMMDKLNHASIIDAAKGSGAVVRVFGHRDYDKLERLLQRSSDARQRVVVTDSLFSMDGDFADLPKLVELKNRYDALLCIDEAHATGIFGRHGRGVAELMEVEDQIDVVVGTLSKALGGIGGFIAASAEIVDWIANTAGAFIYTTAPPPAACAAAMAALEVVEQEPERRQRVLKHAQRLRAELMGRPGFDLADSCSQIVPFVVGESNEALRLSKALEEEGLLVPAIRPPTVPKGKARLRISLSSQHKDEDLDRLVEALVRHHQPRKL